MKTKNLDTIIPSIFVALFSYWYYATSGQTELKSIFEGAGALLIVQQGIHLFLWLKGKQWSTQAQKGTFIQVPASQVKKGDYLLYPIAPGGSVQVTGITRTDYGIFLKYTLPIGTNTKSTENSTFSITWENNKAIIQVSDFREDENKLISILAPGK